MATRLLSESQVDNLADLIERLERGGGSRLASASDADRTVSVTERIRTMGGER